MFLIDTNIFLEILLNQDKTLICKDFLNKNIKDLNISDFSLHSIGVILFRNNSAHVFNDFFKDVVINIRLKHLSKNNYNDIVDIKKHPGLDFDDSYQYCICKEYNLTLVTMDKDFYNIKDIDILFL
ncbi:MAG TPA: VapC toxin family PIN domain ribonuclease [Flexistipes sinusarabici]|uniref:VapC toxin family PIN domain ribonuclease n=1 Tax=Flexistipes sinusarabici TaxID=2352 RepID=A0A3D5QCZ4_FLESI|nr:VapC toxin family PIN domain ribonuclease [Flexistipes sinusarabici]